MGIAQIRDWSNLVLKQLKECSDVNNDKYIFLAGNKYRKFILPELPNNVVPMEGLTIGRQLQFLKAKLNDWFMREIARSRF
jgi:hypothetical protein